MFEALEAALALVAALKKLVGIIEKSDRSLADQIRRAASGVALCLGEGSQSRKGNKIARYQEALASAKEVKTALQVAVTWDYVSAEQSAAAIKAADRTVAITWRLVHPRR